MGIAIVAMINSTALPHGSNAFNLSVDKYQLTSPNSSFQAQKCQFSNTQGKNSVTELLCEMRGSKAVL